MNTIATTFSKASSAILTMSSTSGSSTETEFSPAGVETTTTTMFYFVTSTETTTKILTVSTGTITSASATETVIPTFYSTSVLKTSVTSSIITFESTKYDSFIQNSNLSYLNIFTNGFDTPIFSNTNPAIQTCNKIDKVTINDNQFNMLSDYPVGVNQFSFNFRMPTWCHCV